MTDSESGCSRESFLERAGLGLAAAALGAEALGAPVAAPAAEPANAGSMITAKTPEEALRLLKEGNARFVAGQSECSPLSARIFELESGQSPFAIVLGCSDSRVPIEWIFDQEAGNLFVVRVAGNFLNVDNYGSVEYGVAALKAKIILVLGHTRCGAVDAAVGYVRSGTEQPGHIADIVKAIVPAAREARGHAGDWLADAIAENVRRNVAAMTSGSEIVAEAVHEGRVAVIGGIYQLHTGRVIFLYPEP